MSDIREKLEKIRDDCIKNTIDRAYATGGTPEFDKMYHGFADAILSIVREAVKERKPLTAKPIRKGQKITKLNEGYNEGVSDYHSALMEVLK